MVDDPVGATTVHGVGGIWGVIAVGLFAEAVPLGTTNARSGALLGGGWYLFSVQSLAALSLTMWGMMSTLVMLSIVNKIISLRNDHNEEVLGSDSAEHNMEEVRCGSCDNNEVKVDQSRSEQKRGKDNYGFEGRFILKTPDSHVVSLT